MSTRANPMAIGAFVLGGAILVATALLVWGGTGLFRTKLDYVLFFDAAVTGLSKGAPVLARGVRVGEVTAVELRWSTPYIAVYISLQPDFLKGVPKGGARSQIEQAVQRGLRAQLRTQSLLTGVLYVALDIEPNTPIVLRGFDKGTPELPTIPTDLEVWTAKLDKAADMIEKLPIQHMVQTMAEALDELKRIVGSPEAGRILKDAGALIGDARTLVQRLDTQSAPLIAQAKGTLTAVDAMLADARQLATAVTAQVGPLAGEADATLKAARSAVGRVEPLVGDVQRLVAKVDAQADPLLLSLRSTSDSARVTMERAQLTLGGVDRTLDQESPLGYEAVQTLREVREAARALRSLADFFERVPDAAVYGLRRPGGGNN